MTSPQEQRIQDITACPHCRVGLAWSPTFARCDSCARQFPLSNGVVHFVQAKAGVTADELFQEDVMTGKSIAAKLHNWGRRIISSEYMPRNHVSDFLEEAPRGSVIVELGSGSRSLREDVINLDLFAFPNVDLTADIALLPFRDDSVDFFILDTVLEHVPEPQKIAAEILRTLKPGGKVISITPFIFPYHGYPRHYYNFTSDGLDFLFRDFTDRRIETNMGPTSGLLNLLSEYVAVAVSRNNKMLYTLSKGLVLLPIFFLKYLDRLWPPAGRSTRIANHLCIIARK